MRTKTSSTCNLTDSFVKSLKSIDKSQKRFYDAKIAGFGIRVTTNRKSFFLRYRIAGRERLHTIGQYPAWKTKDARIKASELKRDIDNGIDPQQKRQDDLKAPTLADLWLLYKENHLPTKATRSAQDDESMWHTYLLPRFGKSKLKDIQFADVDILHKEITKTKPVRANRVIEVLKKAFNLGIHWNIASHNPCLNVKKNKEQPRQFYCTPEQVKAIFEALNNQSPQTASHDAIRMLILTGARKSEVLQARWQDVNLEQGIWTKQAQHTKQRKLHRVPLSDDVIEILKRRYQSRSCDWVFEGAIEGHPLQCIKRTFKTIKEESSVILWQRDFTIHRLLPSLPSSNTTYKSIKKLAEQMDITLPNDITPCRIHDLRHTFASAIISNGHDLKIVSALLGHSNIISSNRYSHLYDDTLRKASNSLFNE